MSAAFLKDDTMFWQIRGDETGGVKIAREHQRQLDRIEAKLDLLLERFGIKEADVLLQLLANIQKAESNA